MIDVRNHGGKFGSGKYRKGIEILDNKLKQVSGLSAVGRYYDSDIVNSVDVGNDGCAWLSRSTGTITKINENGVKVFTVSNSTYTINSLTVDGAGNCYSVSQGQYAYKHRPDGTYGVGVNIGASVYGTDVDYDDAGSLYGGAGHSSSTGYTFKFADVTPLGTNGAGTQVFKINHGSGVLANSVKVDRKNGFVISAVKGTGIYKYSLAGSLILTKTMKSLYDKIFIFNDKLYWFYQTSTTIPASQTHNNTAFTYTHYTLDECDLNLNFIKKAWEDIPNISNYIAPVAKNNDGIIFNTATNGNAFLFNGYIGKSLGNSRYGAGKSADGRYLVSSDGNIAQIFSDKAKPTAHQILD